MSNHLKMTESGRKGAFRAGKKLCWWSSSASNPRTKKLNRQNRERNRTHPPPKRSDAKAEDLYEVLRAHRKKLADEQGYPAYIVLSDKVLHLLCSIRPTTVEEFGQISGIGDFKKEKIREKFRRPHQPIPERQIAEYQANS